MLGGFILTFVGAGIFDIAGGAPLTPLQILWIKLRRCASPAIGLGFDAAVPGLMPAHADGTQAHRSSGVASGSDSPW